MESNIKQTIETVPLSQTNFNDIKHTLNAKELANYFVNNSEYVNLYYDRSKASDQINTVMWCLDRNKDMNFFNEFMKKTTLITIDTCLECSKLMNDTRLTLALEHTTHTKRYLILKAIRDHKFKKLIKLKPTKISSYLFYAYEAKFDKLIKHICKQSNIYLVLLMVLQRPEYNLFEQMLPMSSLNYEHFLLLVTMSQNTALLDYLLVHDKFKYYTTAEGILSTLKFENKCLFKQLIEHQLVSDQVIQEVAANVTLETSEPYQLLIASGRYIV